MSEISNVVAVVERGVCSEPDCSEPIDGWCEGCGAQLCAGCLAHHAEDGCEDAHAAAEWCAQEFAQELALAAVERSGETNGA